MKMLDPEAHNPAPSQNHDPSDSLWQRVLAQTEYALSCGALQSIPTQFDFLEQDGVTFLVRSLDTLARKEQAAKQQKTHAATSGKQSNPFLPYEEDLFVAHLSETHLCLLNKYNVVNHHLLIVTRAFEEQETWLNHRDFFALWACMAEIDGLAFYNGGRTAGASQPHKHLQLIPMPLSPQGQSIPIEGLVTKGLMTKGLMTKRLMADHEFSQSPSPQINARQEDARQEYIQQELDAIPFVHAIAPLNVHPNMPPDQASSQLLDAYHHLLKAVGDGKSVAGDRQTFPYNLLATRRWMMVVPRSQERYASISVNSLGFAGSLFVKDEEQMQILKQAGPMRILQHVAHPKS